MRDGLWIRIWLDCGAG